MVGQNFIFGLYWIQCKVVVVPRNSRPFFDLNLSFLILIKIPYQSNILQKNVEKMTYPGYITFLFINVRSNQLSIINLHPFACTGLKVKSGKPKNYLKEFDEWCCYSFTDMFSATIGRFSLLATQPIMGWHKFWRSVVYISVMKSCITNQYQ